MIFTLILVVTTVSFGPGGSGYFRPGNYGHKRSVVSNSNSESRKLRLQAKRIKRLVKNDPEFPPKSPSIPVQPKPATSPIFPESNYKLLKFFIILVSQRNFNVLEHSFISNVHEVRSKLLSCLIDVCRRFASINTTKACSS